MTATSNAATATMPPKKTTTTALATNKSQQQPQQQQQQQQHRVQHDHHQHHRMQHLHLAAQNPTSSSSFSLIVAAAFTFVIFGLLLAGNCVSGQVDGYEAGVDYPAYETVPRGLAFKCQGRQPGYYADTETRCQVWHWCLHSGHQYSFLCPNGTVFNQAVRVCDWWSNVNCPASEQLYQNNDELYRVPEGNQQQNNL